MHNPEYILDNESHKVLGDFEIQPDHQISSSQPELVIVGTKREHARIVEVAVLEDHRVEITESESKDK